MKRRNINFLLMDGTPNGRIKCTTTNSNIVVYRINKEDIDRCSDIDNLKKCGVYILVGVEEQCAENTDLAQTDVVYIGQAATRSNGESFLARLREHAENKEYFREAILVTTDNDFLGPTEISWLENVLYKLALRSRNYEVKNGNTPNDGSVKREERICDLEDFLELTLLLIGTLGYDIFTPKVPKVYQDDKSKCNGQIISDFDSSVCDFIEKDIVPQDDVRSCSNNEYYLETKREGNPLHAKMLRTRAKEGFVLLKDSELANVNIPERYALLDTIRMRKQLTDSGVIINDNNILLLRDNISFKSPSGAARFVLGREANGWNEWINSVSNQSLGECENHIAVPRNRNNNGETCLNDADNESCVSPNE